MKNLFTIFAILQSLIAFSQENVKAPLSPLDSTIFTNTRKEIFLYDSLNNNTVKRVYSSSSTSQTWWLGGRDLYEYNIDNQLVAQYYSTDYIGNGWVPYRKYTYDYNANQCLSTKISYYYSSSSGGYYNNLKEVYRYNVTNGLLDSISQFSWNNGLWEYSGKHIFEYNANEDLTLMELESSLRVVFTYDSQNKLRSREEQWWDYIYPNQWSYIYKMLYNYDANGNPDIIYSYDFDDYYGWQLSYKNVNYFDTNKLVSTIIFPQAYNDYFQYDYSLFQKNMVQYVLGYYYTNQNTWVQTNDTIFYYYRGHNTSLKGTSPAPELKVYPNPTTSYLRINNLNIMQEHAIRIVDIKGSEVFGYRRIYSNVVTVKTLSKGIYFLQVFEGGELLGSVKFIKQ